MRQELERVEIPGEEAACASSWAVLEIAYAEWTPGRRRSHWPRVAVVATVLGAALAAALSPPGRAVIDEIRSVVGVERAQPALFSLPAEGQLLVASDAGIWVVQRNGSKRLLGEYREASWSPFGRFVVAARENELAALEPDGEVRWTLARPGVRSPRWAGTETDTRISYVGDGRPRVVAGDGTGDGPTCAVSLRRLVAPEWRPGAGFALALAAPSGSVHVMDLDGCVQLWKPAPIDGPRRLEWSSDGSQLLVITSKHATVLNARSGAELSRAPAADATFAPSGHVAARIRSRAGISELVVGQRVLFRGAGELRDLAWSPDAEWILVTWPTADQWIFVRADGKRIRAVADVSKQFRSRTFPRLEGWCCAPSR